MEQFKTRGDDVGCVSAWGSGGLRTEFYRFVRATGRGLKGLFPAGATRRPRSRALKAIEHGNEPDRRTARSDAERFAIELATLKVPVAPQIICKSPTAARLVQLLAEQYGRLALMAGEVDLATLLGVGGGRGSAPTDSAILDSFDGSDVTEERMRREDGLGGDRIVARAHLSMGIAIQPSRLASLLKRNPDLLHNGFFARGLYVVPADLSESRTYQPHAMPAAARDAYREGLRRLLDLPWPEASAIQSMTLSPGAESLYMDLQRGELKRRMSKTGDMHSGPLRTWAERAHAQALGLAGVLHLAENAPHHFATTVSRETMERAARAMVDYFIPTAVDVLGFTPNSKVRNERPPRTTLDLGRRVRVPRPRQERPGRPGEARRTARAADRAAGSASSPRPCERSRPAARSALRQPC